MNASHTARPIRHALLLAALAASALPARSDEPSPKAPARMQWFREAKFGMFIHWGVYSVAAGEWKGATNHAEWLQLTAKIPIAEYTELARSFNPVKFDADAWAGAAADAGMKYMVITAKHHDGFAIYDSPSNPYNIMKVTPFGRDPLKELSAACAKRGLKFCVYYSLGRDWHDPDVPTGTPGSATRGPGSRSNLVDFPDESKKDFAKYFERKVKPQVRELLTRYGPIGILWFDTPEKITKAQSAELLALIRSIQPDCIVNNRIGNGLGDYGTPEQKIPAAKSGKPWETCMTIGRRWGYNKNDRDGKPAKTLVFNLVDVVSKGGNYLLNIGPTGDGVFPEESLSRLADIGRWMKGNGESIYGANPSRFGAEYGETRKLKSAHGETVESNSGTAWRCTTKPGRTYIHLFQWPGTSFRLPPIDAKVKRAALLSDPTRAIEHSQDAEGVTLRLPDKAPDPIATVVRIETEPAAKR